MADRRRTWGLCALLGLVTLVTYAGTWGHGFVNYDDDYTIRGLGLIRELSWATLPSFFEPVVRSGLPEYMPLKNLSYALDYAWFGLWAPGFRFQQQLWYLASVLLFFFWVRSVVLDWNGLRHPAGADAHHARASWTAFAAAALFAVHPCHVESVTWLSGRKDVLSGAFVLAAMLCARGEGRWRTPVSLACTGLALLSKPTAVVLPGLLLVQDVPGAASLSALLRRRWVLYAGSLALCGGFAAFYVHFTEAHAAVEGAAVTARAFEGPVWSRWGQQLWLFLRFAVVPFGWSPLLPTSLLDPDPWSARALWGMLVAGGLLALGVWALRARHVVVVAWGLGVLPLIPILVAPPWQQYVAGRYLFHAVGGLCLAVALGAAHVASRQATSRRGLVVAVATLGVLWGAVSVDYNATWRNGSSLWLGALRHYPHFTQLHDLAAQALLGEGKPAQALAVLETCVQIDPHDGTCLGRLGELLLKPSPEDGERLLRRALAEDPTLRTARALASHLATTGRVQEALALLEPLVVGRGVGVADLRLLVQLSLSVGAPERALMYCRHMVRAAAVNHPGSPAPVATVLTVARATGDRELEARVRRVSSACRRSDCFRQGLGW